jgi:hypothetical protein
MNRYIMIRRLRAPAILLLIGVIALLHQTGAIDHFWHLFWPLLLILVGVLLLAERTALAADGYPQAQFPGAGYPSAGYPGAPYAGAVDPHAAAPGQAPAEQSTAIVPADSPDRGIDREGGQS